MRGGRGPCHVPRVRFGAFRQWNNDRDRRRPAEAADGSVPRSLTRWGLLPCGLKLAHQRVEAVWGDWQLLDCADTAERIIDCGRDRGTRRSDAGFTGAFDAERIERCWCILKEEDLDLGDLGNRRQQVIGESHRLRLSGGVVHEFFEQRGTDALSGAAGDLPLDQHWVYRTADVEADDV